MQHKESDTQIRLFKWFRYEYPAYARLIEHPHNEGNGLNRKQQVIANAEGVTKGVSDIILHVPSFCIGKDDSIVGIFYSLGIELKTPTGYQSPEQKLWQRMFEAAGNKYELVRDYDTGVAILTKWMLNVPQHVDKAIKAEYEAIIAEENRREVNKLKMYLKKSEE